MAEAAVTFLVDQLFVLLNQFVRPVNHETHISFFFGPQHLCGTISDIESGLEKQEHAVRLLKALLRDAAALPRELGMERQIKELVYDIEEIRESWFIWKAAAERATNTIRYRNPLNTLGYELTREVKSIINNRLDPMIQGFADLRLVQEHSTQAIEVPSVLLNKKIPPIGIKNIVGLEDEAKNLISHLEETETHDVISITSMPGLGKTTLAWKIYQNEKIRSAFPSRFWVDNPEDICWKDLCISILKEFSYHGKIDVSKYDSIDEHDLILTVRACLEKSRFLLVLDAVWTTDTLQSIMQFLPRNGKVLITSRDTSVCVAANVTRKPHVMRFLNEKESWDLLQLEVFGKLDECPEMLKSTGECIAKNCDGFPLAIVAVASSLMVTSSTVVVKYMNEKWWKKMAENIIVSATDLDQQRVFKRVELSYIKLTRCLQDCFLYLGVFPKGHEIPVRTLIGLWIAERLVQVSERQTPERPVQDSEGPTLEKTALQILDDLIHRNLVMVGKSYPNGQIKTCRLHKVMYRFCKHKAMEQDFYHEIKLSKGKALDRSMPLTPNHRRLCIDSCLSKFFASRLKGRCVRSIICLRADKQVLQPKSVSNIYKSLKLLKVFECKCIKFAKFPTNLSKLMNLRYISLSCDDLDVIPEAISSLCYLETLVVETQSASLKLKANIWRMPQLQHLVSKAAIVLAVRGRGEAGQNLQTLTRLAPECCTEDVLRRAIGLNRLGIRGQLTALSSAAVSLNNLERLQHLKLVNEAAAADSRLQNLLQQNFFPQNMRRLTLSATYLGWEWMSVLGQIDSLEILKLKNNAITGESWKIDADGFRGLVFLWIGTTNLVSWEASSADCFPQLLNLSVSCLRTANNSGKFHPLWRKASTHWMLMWKAYLDLQLSLPGTLGKK